MHRLALALGKSIREVEQMGASELDEWALFWEVEPWGAYRDNLHAAIIASVIANAHRKKNAKAFSIEDFILRDRRSTREGNLGKFVGWLKASAKRKKGSKQ